MTPFAELAVTTNFSFLRGGSHPEELVREAADLGLAGIAVADRNTLAGVVRGHVMAKETAFRYAVGCRLVFRDGTPDIIAWPTDRAAYGRLCRLLTLGNLRAEKGECHLDLRRPSRMGRGHDARRHAGEQLRPSALPPNRVKLIPFNRSFPRKRESRTSLAERLEMTKLGPRLRGDERRSRARRPNRRGPSPPPSPPSTTLSPATSA